MGNKHNEIQVIKIIKNQKLENQDAFLQNVKNCENSSLKKSPKQWHKKFAVGCLAVLMCSVAFLGVGCINTSGSLSGTANGGSATNSGGVVSPFGLCPETDPVVYTTESGLEIKCSNALTNTNLASYTYFTMGEYEGTPVNWVIIGYDPSVSGYVGEYTGDTQFDPIQGGHSFGSTVDNSPMGTAIRKEMFAISNSAVESDEIGDGCVLVLSECTLGKSVFGSNNNYEGSELQEFVLDYPNLLGFSESENKLIIPQDFCSVYYNNQISYSENQTMFIMGGGTRRTEQATFAVGDYLKNDQLTKCCDLDGNSVVWRARAGSITNSSETYVYRTDGTAYCWYSSQYDKESYAISTELGVRPAFVMKLA